MSSPTSVSSSSTQASLSSARARHVFGDLVLDEAESPVGSLSYSLTSKSDPLSPVDITRKDQSVSDAHPKMIDFVHHNKENFLHNQPQNGRKVSFSENFDNPYSRKEELNRLRMQSQSPKKRDLVKRTQDAINNATISVNQSLVAAHHAKVISLQHRITETAKLRDKWKEEKVEAQEFHAEAEKNRQELLTLQKHLSSKFRTAKNVHDRSEKQNQLDAIVRESEFKSEVFRQQQQKLKEERDQRRRESTEKRAKVRRNHREGEEKLLRIQIEEDQALHDERYALSLATRGYQKRCADERRKSFQFRTGDARRIRDIHARMESKRQQEEKESFELKFAAERDVCAYRRKMDEDRRNSFAFRNMEGRKQRNVDDMKRSDEVHAEQASYQLKFAADRDVDGYKKLMAEQRRKSLSLRNKEAHRQRERHHEQMECEMLESHQSYELKWDGENDAKAYERQMIENRRKSLAGRNRKGKQERDEEDQRQSQAKEDARACYALKFAAERDVHAYFKKESEDRRKSLAFRNKEALKQRNDAVQRFEKEQALTHEGYELKWAGEKDTEAYQRRLEKEHRDDLRFRNQELAGHDKVMKELQALALDQQHESFVLKWAGENDTKEYLAQIEYERRKSLQFRNQECKRHRELEDEAHNATILLAHEEEVLQAAGGSYMADCLTSLSVRFAHVVDCCLCLLFSSCRCRELQERVC